MAGRLKNALVLPPKEEPRRRHRIKDVRLYNREGRAGMQLVTKSGIVTIPCLTKRPEVVYHRIKHFIPHMYEALTEHNTWNEDQLKDLLIGRYLYGRIQAVEYEGTVTMAIV